MTWPELTPGERYRVEFTDCCVAGYFEDVFREVGINDEGDTDALIFEHSRIEQEWGSYKITAAAA